MSRSTVIFFFAALLLLVVIARYNSRSRLAEEHPERTAASPPQLTLQPSATPAIAARSAPIPSPSSTEQAADLENVAKRVQPAIALISVFEPSGKLLRNGTGFFVSGDGKILTSRSLLEGAAYAVANMSGGKIANIKGLVADVSALDLAILKAELDSQVPFVRPEEAADAKEGDKIAIINGPSEGKAAFFQDVVSKRVEQEHGISLELSYPVPNQSLGSPVVSEQGKVIGVVTGPGAVVRTFSAVEPVLADASSSASPHWLVTTKTEQISASPAESPQKNLPWASGPDGKRSKLTYTPLPRYPRGVLRPGMPRKDGRFQILFSSDGEAKNVTVIRSTESEELDKAAIDALRQWKSEPGQQWVLTVPVTFKQ